jgi:transposase
MAIDLRAAIEAKLRRPLPVFVAGLRAAGWSWREISEEIDRRTGVVVSHESLRQWFRDSKEQP